MPDDNTTKEERQTKSEEPERANRSKDWGEMKKREGEIAQQRKQEFGELRGRALYSGEARKEEEEKIEEQREAERRARKKWSPGYIPDPLAREEEEKRLMRLEEERRTQEMAGEEAAGEETEEKGAKKEGGPFINAGEAALLLAFTGAVEGVQFLLDFIPYLGWIINIVITAIVGGILLIWMTGKVAKGAPKKWYKAIYWGAAGGAIPIVPGYLGAIIWLLIQDRKVLGKIGGKLGEAIGKIAEKA